MTSLPRGRAFGGGWRAIMALPLTGGLILGGAACVFFFSGTETLPAFVLFFLIGALLGLLVGWPVLWLVERFLVTPWRYVIGGAGPGLLIWLGCVAPLFVSGPALMPKGVVALPPLFWVGPVVFVACGLLAGALYTALTWMRGRAGSGPRRPG